MQLTSLIVVLVYFLGVIGFTHYQSRHDKQTREDYLIGERKFGLWSLLASMNSTWLNAGWIVFAITLIMTDIYYYVWMMVATALAMGILMVYAPKLRQMSADHNVNSISEFVHRFIGPSSGHVIAFINFIIYMTWLMIEIVAGSHLLSLIFDVPYMACVLTFAVVIGIYLFIGGFRVLIQTDILQFFLALIMIGIFYYSFDNVQDVSFGEVFAPSASYNLNGFIDGFMALFPPVLFGAEVWQRMIAAKDGRTAAWLMPTTYVTNLAVYIPLFALPVLMYWGTDVTSGETILANAMTNLPAFLAPIALVAVVALIMSTIDTTCFLSAQSFMNDIVGHMNKDVAEHPRRHLKWSILAALLLASLGALVFQSTVDNIHFVLTLWIAFSPVIYPLVFTSWPSDKAIALSIALIGVAIIGTQIIGVYTANIGFGLFIAGFIVPFIFERVVHR